MDLTIKTMQNPSHNPNCKETHESIVPMFEKVVTPSDVGKLNRLVIPKQHAEKHFPRLKTPMAGMQLCFEDRATGEPWQFRYSYWNSSQSYVITKGWSRFVRDKRLLAGDTVAFSRDPRRGNLLIGYHHRGPHPVHGFIKSGSDNTCCNRRTSQLYFDTLNKGDTLYFGANMNRMEPMNFHSDTNCFSTSIKPIITSLDSKAVVYGVTGAKRVRLFGVNLEFLDPDLIKERIGAVESNTTPLLDLKL